MAITFQTQKTTNAPLTYRDTALQGTKSGVSSVPCELTGFNIINSDTADVYVKFYDASSGSTTVGTTVPILTVYVPASSTIFQPHRWKDSIKYFATAMTIVSVTTLADSGTTNPGTATYIEVYYKST